MNKKESKKILDYEINWESEAVFREKCEPGNHRVRIMCQCGAEKMVKAEMEKLRRSREGFIY